LLKCCVTAASLLAMIHKPASLHVGLAILVCCSCTGGGATAKDVPTALEASYKDRISAVLNGSAEAAASHIKKRLALGAGDSVFGGYELDIGQEGKWLHSCIEVDSSRDSVENCALRQLQALVALCDVPGIFKRDEDARMLVEQHVTTLLKTKKVAALGLSLSAVSGTSLFFHQKSPGAASADDLDVSPTIQASVLMAVVRCGEALGIKSHLDEAETWFVGLGKVYPHSIWNQSLVSFHRSSIMWESLSVIASHVSRSSSFHEDLQEYLGQFEMFLRQVWEESPESWSFSSARALALRWQSKGLKKKRRAMLKRWAKEHVDRFLGRQSKAGSLAGSPEKSVSEGILAKIGGAGYTCGPLQGLAALAAVLNDPELIQVVLQLLEKDIKHYQLSDSNSGPFKEMVSPSTLGAFFRDEQQLKMERRRSFRVDDTAMCLIALTQALEVLAGIQGVVVGDSTPVKATSSESSTEL